MQSLLEFKVQYFDTDAYGVVWHGSYLRWMEIGRVDLLEKYGLQIEKLQNEKNVVMPVIELDIKYKHGAKLMDEVVLLTKIIEKTRTSVTFLQEISLKNSGKICTSATVKATALKDGRVQRNVDEFFVEK